MTVHASAAIARGIGAAFEIEEVELDEPRQDEAIVRIVAVGICHTDMSMRDHKIYPVPHPIVMGHEGAGIVERVGSAVTKVAPGDHVVLSFGSCGKCPSCLNHRPSYCDSFYEYNFAGGRCDCSTTLRQHGKPVHTFQSQGSFATHAVVAERAMVKVRKDVPLEYLAPMGCAVQTGAGGVLNSLGLKPNESLAVFGTGSVGLSALMAANLAGAGTLIAVDLVDSRLELARELGATHVINPSRQDSYEEIMRITEGRGLNYTFDTTANMKILKTAMAVLAKSGVCGFVGGAPKGMEVTVDVEHMMTGGRALRGIILGDCDPDVFIPQMADLFERGRFPIDRIIRTYPFAEINKAVEDSEHGTTVKPVLKM